MDEHRQAVACWVAVGYDGFHEGGGRWVVDHVEAARVLRNLIHGYRRGVVWLEPEGGRVYEQAVFGEPVEVGRGEGC